MFDTLDRFSARTALIADDGSQITYGALLDAGAALARRVPHRSLMISLASNTPEFVSSYVGFMRAGIAQLLVNEAIPPEFLSRLIEIYAPSHVYLPAAAAARHGLAGKSEHASGSYRLVALEPRRSYELHPDLALLLSTSGSTGSPKLVRLSYQNLRANTDSIIRSLGAREDDRAITTMPLSYSYGLSILNTHLTLGALLVVTEASLMSRDFWRLLKEQSVTNFGGVPYVYEMLKKLRFERQELPALRYLTQAGGRLNRALAEEFQAVCSDKKIRFFMMYGQTEATARMSCFCVTDYPQKAGTIGQAIPGGSFSLIDDEGNTIGRNDAPGELVYRGPNVSMGMAERSEDLSLGDTRQGVLHTGDIASRDVDGFFSIVGRKSRFLKVFGIRVNLAEVEELLKTKGYECACSGVDDKLSVYMTRVDDRERVLSMLAELTGVNKSGFEVVQIERLPRSESGKVLYHELRGGR